MTDTLLDEELLILLNLEFDEFCQYHECREPRTHLLTCPRCPGVENLCEEHANYMKNAPFDRKIYLTASCNHHVFMRHCGKIRIRAPR